MEYMIRDWVNWCWLSGDHIVEQHVHNIDVISWFTGKKPVSAVSFGARQRRSPVISMTSSVLTSSMKEASMFTACAAR